MTCIASLIRKNHFFIAGDSRITCGSSVIDIPKTDRSMYPKIFTNSGFVIGVCDSIRVANVLKYSLKINTKKLHKYKNIHEFMVTEFVDSVRTCLTDSGCMRKFSTSTEFANIEMIVMYQGEVYQVGSWFSVIKVEEPYFAIGSGASYAKGSLHSTESTKSPKKRLKIAIDSAKKYQSGVGGDTVIFKYKV